jgi:hypothetical protein
MDEGREEDGKYPKERPNLLPDRLLNSKTSKAQSKIKSLVLLWVLSSRTRDTVRMTN